MAPESLFIDIMMNVPLIFYAARETGDRDPVRPGRWLTAARPSGLWSDPTARLPTRGFSTSDTGVFLRQSTHQGLRADSTWTRGLAWSLYGFGTVFTYTDDPADLRSPSATPTAISPLCREPCSAVGFRRAARAPTASTTARPAAIAASGLWNLAELDGHARSGASRPLSQCGAHHSRFPLHRPLPGLVRPRAGKACSSTASIISTKNWAWTSRSCGAISFFLEAVDKVLGDHPESQTGAEHGV